MYKQAINRAINGLKINSYCLKMPEIGLKGPTEGWLEFFSLLLQKLSKSENEMQTMSNQEKMQVRLYGEMEVESIFMQAKPLPPSLKFCPRANFMEGGRGPVILNPESEKQNASGHRQGRRLPPWVGNANMSFQNLKGA